jgi:hypothetical protein
MQFWVPTRYLFRKPTVLGPGQSEVPTCWKMKFNHLPCHLLGADGVAFKASRFVQNPSNDSRCGIQHRLPPVR